MKTREGDAPPASGPFKKTARLAQGGSMSTKRITESSNPILAGSLPALRRSAERAKKLAEQTGTRLIVVTKKTTRRPSKSSDKQ